MTSKRPTLPKAQSPSCSWWPVLQRLLRFGVRHEKIGWTALMILKDLDFLGPSSQRELAEIEQVRAPTMTVLINQMERKGWVQRRVQPR